MDSRIQNKSEMAARTQCSIGSGDWSEDSADSEYIPISESGEALQRSPLRSPEDWEPLGRVIKPELVEHMW